MAREPGLDTFRGALARGARLAKRHVEPQAAIYQAVLNDLAREAAGKLRVQAVTAAGAMPNPDSIYDIDQATARLQAATEPGRMAMVADTVGGVSNVWGASFDVTNPLMANLLTGMGQKITRIAEWQRAGLMNVVQHGYDQGHSIVKIADGMLDPSTTLTSASRAAMIARTELTQATQGAGLASAQTLDISKFKQWLAASDSRTRADHSYVSGQVVKLKAAFNVNGHMMQHPGDPAGPAKETVHCRCVLVYTDDPEGLAGVPKHDDIQRQANDPEIIADDQRWLKGQRRRYKTLEDKRSNAARSAEAEMQQRAAEEAKLSTPGIHHRRDLTPDDAWERHGTAARRIENVGGTGRHADLPEYRPRRGSEFTLTTRHGQRIDVFHERHQLSALEGGSLPDSFVQQSVMRRLEELRAQLDSLPRKAAENIRQIRLMAGRNPGDAYWAAMRGNSSWEAVATGGNGRIQWWGGRKADYGTLAHESGHTIAGDYRYTLPAERGVKDLGLPPTWWDQREVWGGPPDGDKWMSLARADSKYRKDLWYDHETGWQSDIGGHGYEWLPEVKQGHTITQSSGAVTSYGADSLAEDFAESVRLWALDRKHGYLGTYSDGTRIRFKDLFPRRAGYLSRLLGGK